MFIPYALGNAFQVTRHGSTAREIGTYPSHRIARGNALARKLTPERELKKSQAITLRKMGWTQQAIADEIIIPRRTISDWFGGIGLPSITATGRVRGKKAKANKVAKPRFLSWCGKVEEFEPEEDIRTILMVAVAALLFEHVSTQMLRAGVVMEDVRTSSGSHSVYLHCHYDDIEAGLPTLHPIHSNFPRHRYQARRRIVCPCVILAPPT